MSKIPIEQFLRQTLGLNIAVISNKNWARFCCPIHGETRPSCGTLLVYPYVTKCFACGYKASLPRFTAHLLKKPLDKAISIINEAVEVVFDLEQSLGHRDVNKFVPSVVAEMLEFSLSKSLAQRYLKYRSVPMWAARMMGVGYDDLNKSMTVPMVNTVNHKVQGYALVQFQGTFDDTRKNKNCQNANETVSTVTGIHGNVGSCIVVEGAVDAMRLLCLPASRSIGAFVPVALNTAFPSREQITYIRGFEKIIIGLDHDDAGEKGKDWLIRHTEDRPLVYELNYPEDKKDPGELNSDDVLTTSLILRKGKGWNGSNSQGFNGRSKQAGNAHHSR